jgi:hypothetical protein
MMHKNNDLYFAFFNSAVSKYKKLIINILIFTKLSSRTHAFGASYLLLDIIRGLHSELSVF